MKKKIAFVAAAVCVFCSGAVACAKKEKLASFYGVACYVEEYGDMVVRIPRLGEVCLPTTKETYSMFTPGEYDYEYSLQEGDLVSITFSGEVRTSESHPAKFDKTAESIKAYMQGLSLSRASEGWLFTQPLPDDFFDGGDQANENEGKQTVAAGEVLQYAYFLGDGHGAVGRFVFCECEVISYDEQTDEVSFLISDDLITEFLESLPFSLRLERLPE